MRNLSRPIVLLLLIHSAAFVVLFGGATRLSSAPSATQAVPRQDERAAHMRVHFAEAMTAHEAVIRGDLAAARQPAAWLAEHEAPQSLPPEATPFLADMRRAARRTADATTVLEAALGTADMLKTCGDCHRSLGTRPAAPLQPPRADVPGVVGHMLAHQAAADQMLQGLVVPSSALWRSGTNAFRGASLRRRELPKGAKLAGRMMDTETRIHTLATAAHRAEEAGARAVFYGQIIARCADCHALHREAWGPARH